MRIYLNSAVTHTFNACLRCAALLDKDRIMKLLHIDSSVLGTNSVSRQLTAQIVASWRGSHHYAEADYLGLAGAANDDSAIQAA